MIFWSHSEVLLFIIWSHFFSNASLFGSIACSKVAVSESEYSEVPSVILSTIDSTWAWAAVASAGLSDTKSPEESLEDLEVEDCSLFCERT